MADFNQILDAGDVDGGIINVVVEIPAGSNHKIEWKRKVGALMLDRVEPLIFAKPTNYGFIPQTLDEDGDELDALIITDTPLPTGVYLEARGHPRGRRHPVGCWPPRDLPAPGVGAAARPPGLIHRVRLVRVAAPREGESGNDQGNKSLE